MHDNYHVRCKSKVLEELRVYFYDMFVSRSILDSGEDMGEVVSDMDIEG